MLSAFLDRFIYEEDKKDPASYLRGRFFIVFQFIFSLLNIISLPYYFSLEILENAPLLKWLYVLVCLLMLSCFWIYPKYGYRILFVNLHSVIATSTSMYTTYYYSGGLFSPDHVFAPAITIYGFLVANRITGIVWTILGSLQFLFFYYAAVHHWLPFQETIAQFDENYYFFTILFSVVFAVTLILLYENMMRRLLAIIYDTKAKVEEKNREIMESITYSRRIQEAILPEVQDIEEFFVESFVLYQPKHIVSGDFYFFQKYDHDTVLIAAADCTGHGIPGAFMSLICSEKLKDASLRQKNPGLILEEVNRNVKKALRQKHDHDTTRDGMDIALCTVKKSTGEIEFSGAYRPLWIVQKQDGELKEYKSSRASIAGLTADDQVFATMKFELQKGDTVYLCSDGFADSFNEAGKKLTTRKLKELLCKISELSLQEQHAYLKQFIEEWIGAGEQIDDILILAFRL